MNHDALCPLTQPCSPQHPQHGMCGNSLLNYDPYCIHCERECFCDLIHTVRDDMLSRCQEAAHIDLLALEDDMVEAFGKGDAARIVAGYRSTMPSFRRLRQESQQPEQSDEAVIEPGTILTLIKGDRQ